MSRRAAFQIGGAPARTSSGVAGWLFDTWTTGATTGPSAYSLSGFPVFLSPSIVLDEATLLENVDYSIDYTAGVLTVSRLLTAGQDLSARYEYSGLTHQGGIVPLTAPHSTADQVGQIGGAGGLDLTWTPRGCSAMFLATAYATASLSDDVLELTDTWGYSWQKIIERNVQNAANPDTVHLAIWTAHSDAAAPAGTIHIPAFPASQFFAARVLEFDTAVCSLNAGYDEGLNVTSLAPTLATTPGAVDGVLIVALSWPHKTMTFPGATDTGLTDQPGGGPYGQELRMGYAYTVAGHAPRSFTVDNNAGADSIAAAIAVRPTEPC